jgi:hypothetical protein
VAYATVDDLAGALHVRVTPENQTSLQRALDAAAAEVDHDLDRPLESPLPDPAPPAIVQANIALAVEAYKLPDSAFGVLGFDDTGAVRAAKDSLPRYWGLLTPFKQGWGVA